MQVLPVLGAGACAALFVFAWPADAAAPTPTHAATASAPAAAASATADGHLVLIVQGDRDQLAIAGAVPKTDPWAGVPKGMTSDWRLEIRAADQSLLASVPLDVTPFATDPQAQHRPLRVEGCLVIDSRIAMLVNAPHFAEAASYTFHRGNVLLGTTSAEQVAKLAGGGR